MRILILGGDGFLGKSLHQTLSNSQHEVLPLSRRDGLDLTDIAITTRLLRENAPDVIYNCAAHVGGLHYVGARQADVLTENLQMAISLYSAVRDVCPRALLINPLSNCSYPGDLTFYREQEWLSGEVHQSVYSYGNAKRVLYVLARCYKMQYGIRTHNLLMPNAFGPGDSTDPNKVHALNGMIIRMLRANMGGAAEFEVWGTGAPIREWIYIFDAANILVKAMALDTDLIFPVNIAQERGYSIRESAERIASAVGFQGKLVFCPEYEDGAPSKILASQKFRELFPDYDFIDHDEGICRTVDYYRAALCA